MVTSKQMISVILVVLIISIGQLMFKHVSSMIDFKANGVWTLFNPYLIGALGLYGVATLAWIILLAQVPLNIAYPLFALAFVIVPLLSTMIFREPYTLKMLAGGGTILLGVYLIYS